MTLSPGAVIAGKYRIESVLGEGGMGVVYVATNERLHKRVALKVLSESVAGDPEAAARFTREAIAASRIQHPGVVDIFDADVHEGSPWMAMELLEGESLGDRIARGALPLDEALRIAREIVAVLVKVHASGIVHRDLKPDNVFLVTTEAGPPRVKVLDFGIAKIVDHELGSHTKTGMAMGTPFFLAPEQATNAKQTDARADLYSVGVILYHALSGQLPYHAESFGELVKLFYTSGPRSLRDARPGLPDGLVAIVDRCLSVSPDGRPASADELGRALAALDAPAPEAPKRAVAKTVAMESDPGVRVSAPTMPLAQEAPRPMAAAPEPNYVPLILGAVLVVVTGLAVASFAWGGGDDEGDGIAEAGAAIDPDDDTPPPPDPAPEAEPPARPGAPTPPPVAGAIPAPPDVAAPPPSAQRTSSGLASRVLRAGTGTRHPNAQSRVTVHYTGWTTDGRMFDSSRTRGNPATFGLNQVIPGWTEGVQLMVEGEERRLWIPEDLAYRGRPGAPAGMLVFDVELISFETPPAPHPVPADVAAPPRSARRTRSGLSYLVVRPGTGTQHPTATSRVRVHYTGWTTDGRMFDSSLSRGEPATFGLNQVIAGWTEGVQLMVVGERSRFWIPESLAYQGRPGSPAGMLVFDIELLEILP